MSEEKDMKKLLVFIDGKKISEWRFFTKLRLCLYRKANTEEWTDFDFDLGMKTCKKLMQSARGNIKVTGSLTSILSDDSRIADLLSGKKIILRR